MSDDARGIGGELATSIGDLVGVLSDGGFGLEQRGPGFRRLLQHHVFLLFQHDDVVVLAEGGQPGLGIVEFPLVASRLAGEELVSSRRGMKAEVGFQIRIG